MDKENKVFELMTKMYSEFSGKFDEINNRFDKLENEMQEMKSDMQEMKNDIKDLKEGQLRIENKIDDTEANNADRHISINGELKRLKSDMARVEMNTADNWKDIARLKSTK